MCKKLLISISLCIFSCLFSMNIFALSDPMKPDFYSTPAKDKAQMAGETQWILSSILISSKRKVATINGQLVGIGDKVEQAKVVAISIGQITLVQKGKKFKLFLAPSIAKTRNNTGG